MGLFKREERSDARSERSDARSERSDARSERSDARSERSDARSERSDTRSVKPAVSVQTRREEKYRLPVYSGERELYKALRETVPIIDASIYKLRRLLGGFTVSCDDENAEKELAGFLENVKVNASSNGIDAFIGVYFEELLTYGNAVGEIVMSGEEIAGLYNASLSDVEIENGKALETKISLIENGTKTAIKYPELLLVSALNPAAGEAKGTSILRGLPFVSGILMKIYQTIGTNWERLGNVRFAVSCKSDGDVYAADRAKQMASEWQKAMRSHEINDFVAVGDVKIQTIGADNQILESEIPVRQMLEQIVAKMGIPPFLLGLSWSSTERMSSQQADVLTTELDAYRAILTPVIGKICRMWLILNGYAPEYSVEWNEITMQDEVDHANARYLTARAETLEREMRKETE